ncbi:MAG: SH3 domain-containing protein [Alphaproteobacteria bacterium]
MGRLFGLCIGLSMLLLVAGQSLAQEPLRVRGIWQGVITARSLNVRGGPGENYDIVSKLKRGAKVEAVDAIGRWVRLNMEGEAWVHRRFVKLPEDFMAPAFSDAENAFLDWAAARGDLEEVSVDDDGRISVVLTAEQGDDAAVAATIARDVGCGYREQLAYELPVTVTVWPEAGPAEGWVAQASCP